MSQRALVGALVEHISPKLPSLFAPGPDDVRAALAALGKKREFGELSRTFFAKLTNVNRPEYFGDSLS